MDYEEEEEEDSDEQEEAPTSPLLRNGYRMGAGTVISSKSPNYPFAVSSILRHTSL